MDKVRPESQSEHTPVSRYRAGLVYCPQLGCSTWMSATALSPKSTRAPTFSGSSPTPSGSPCQLLGDVASSEVLSTQPRNHEATITNAATLRQVATDSVMANIMVHIGRSCACGGLRTAPTKQKGWACPGRGPGDCKYNDGKRKRLHHALKESSTTKKIRPPPVKAGQIVVLSRRSLRLRGKISVAVPEWKPSITAF
jgi:hypothetical protein